jgi:DNA polymerase-3 subunit delta'
LTAAPDRLPHALLLHGPRGIGKQEFAGALGQWLLCEAPGTTGGCGGCTACRWQEQGSHPDFRLIEPAAPGAADEAVSVGREPGGQKEGERKGGKLITIGEIRELGEFLSLAAHQGGWRVVVIHPAEALNPAAANALLKTLEEPPQRVLLILIAHQPRRLLPTVLSRCRKLAMAMPSRDEARAWLAGQGREDAVASLDEVGGAPLLAMECANPERIERRRNFLRSLAKPTPAGLSALAKEQQTRVEESWGWISRWLFDLLSARAGWPPRYFPEAEQALHRLAGQADPVGLWGLQQELAGCGRWLRHPLNGQLLLESWLLCYLEAMETHGR